MHATPHALLSTSARGLGRHTLRAGCLALCLLPGLTGLCEADAKGPGTGTVQSSRLYTAPDPQASGGIQGRFDPPSKPAAAVFVLAIDNWKQVYRAAVAPDGRSFECTGLPVGRYDLLILADNRIVEGLTLSREESTLEAPDLKGIEEAVNKSTPFFDTKRLHRVAGNGGSEGKARALLQEVRTRPVTLQSAEVRSDIQVRSLKLVLAECAGRPGWALVNTREIVRQEVRGGEARGLLPHQHEPRLGGIRVVDAVKDLGNIALP